MEKTVVNSWNEWDPLKHVIVGRADDCHIPPEEPALEAKVPEDSDMRGQWGRRPQETIDRANELLDAFARQLDGFVDGFKKPWIVRPADHHGDSQAHRNAGVHEPSTARIGLTRKMAIKPSEQTIQPGKKMPLINDAVHQS